MWLIITPEQRARCLSAGLEAGFSDTLIGWMSRDSKQLSVKKIGIRMPVVGWDRYRIALREFCYQPRPGAIFPSGRQRGINRTPYLASTEVLSVISRAISDQYTHPAMRGRMMMGHVVADFPVWVLPEPDAYRRLYVPVPVEGCEFRYLEADFLCIGADASRSDGVSMRVTRWAPRTHLSEDPLAQEGVHLELLG